MVYGSMRAMPTRIVPGQGRIATDRAPWHPYSSPLVQAGPDRSRAHREHHTVIMIPGRHGPPAGADPVWERIAKRANETLGILVAL